MTKLAAITAALILGSVALAGGGPIPFDVGCKTKEDMEKYNECAAGCKKTSDAAQKSCNDAYRTCRAGCAGEDKKACRETCRTAYRECSQKQRETLKSCRSDCIDANNCEHIPGTPE